MNTLTRASIHTTLCLLLGIAGGCALSNSVHAGEEQGLPSKTVRYDDLDISRTAGAKVLYSRIRTAAIQVCEDPLHTDPIVRLSAHACIRHAIDEAVKSVASPVLTAMNSGGGDIRVARK